MHILTTHNLPSVSIKYKNGELAKSKELVYMDDSNFKSYFDFISTVLRKRPYAQVYNYAYSPYNGSGSWSHFYAPLPVPSWESDTLYPPYQPPYLRSENSSLKMAILGFDTGCMISPEGFNKTEKYWDLDDYGSERSEPRFSIPFYGGRTETSGHAATIVRLYNAGKCFVNIHDCDNDELVVASDNDGAICLTVSNCKNLTRLYVDGNIYNYKNDYWNKVGLDIFKECPNVNRIDCWSLDGESSNLSSFPPELRWLCVRDLISIAKLDFSDCAELKPFFGFDTRLNFFEHLNPEVKGKVILHAGVYDALTEEQIAVATSKGWTVIKAG